MSHTNLSRIHSFMYLLRRRKIDNNFMRPFHSKVSQKQNVVYLFLKPTEWTFSSFWEMSKIRCYKTKFPIIQIHVTTNRLPDTDLFELVYQKTITNFCYYLINKVVVFNRYATSRILNTFVLTRHHFVEVIMLVYCFLLSFFLLFLIYFTNPNILPLTRFLVSPSYIQNLIQL